MTTYRRLHLAIPYITDANCQTPIENISIALDSQQQHSVEQLPWPQFFYRPDVSFTIAHTNDCIMLKYYVQEKTIRVMHDQDNSPVHEDSCVEFFIAFGDDERYYNIEFNCAGTCLLGFGKNSTERELLSTEMTRKIRRLATIKSDMTGKQSVFTWQLAIAIPTDVFVFHEFSSLSNIRCRVNFYKCGDKLPEPHFLSWQNMRTSTPDFHLAKFFGDAYFE